MPLVEYFFCTHTLNADHVSLVLIKYVDLILLEMHTVLQHDDLHQVNKAVKIIERMVNQITFDEVAQGIETLRFSHLGSKLQQMKSGSYFHDSVINTLLFALR